LRSAFLANPFRVFFLFASVYSIIALLAWVLHLAGAITLDHLTTNWHMREMLFGFVGSVIVGFLLTAGANWTGQKTLTGPPLLIVGIVWCMARFASLSGQSLVFAAALDALVFLTGAVVLGRMVVLSRNTRNYGFPIVLFMFAMFSFFEAYQRQYEVGEGVSYFALKGVFFLMLHIVIVMGGRVIPFFTDRGLGREATVRYPVLEWACLLSSVAFIGVYVLQEMFSLERFNALGWLAGVVGALNLVRLYTWKPWQTLTNLMLWPLHLSYFFICLGFIGMCWGWHDSVAMHVLAIGGFGMVILSMISRVSLGHTGRPLRLGKIWYVAFGALILCLLVRVAAALVFQLYLPLLMLSAVLWSVAYGMFVCLYFPVLTQPRADGRA